VLSTVAIVAILVYLFWKKPQNKLLLASLILITGGGIGNMIDRVFLGYVIDFLDFCAFPSLWMWIFNVADVFVCVGAGLLALWMILDTVKETKAEKAKAAMENAERTGDENDGNE
jgi:signal peptidase II